MKVINNCFVLNKEEAGKIIPILVDELVFNCMVLSAHLKKAKEFKPEMIERVRQRIETLKPFFADYMSNTGEIDDSVCKHVKNMSTEMFADFMCERWAAKKESQK